MQRYQSHKIVEAARIDTLSEQSDGSGILFFPGAEGPQIKVSKGFLRRMRMGTGSLTDLGYFVRYEDGYESWSPTAVFEAGYTLILPGDVDTVVERDGTVRGAPIPDLGDSRR